MTEVGVPAERAVALVVRDGRVLVIRRHRPGRDYAVLPGGGVEPGESADQAVLRELAEETGLDGRADWLFDRQDAGRTAHYFLITEGNPAVEPVLGDPERVRQAPDDRYQFEWIDAAEVSTIGLQPSAVVPLVVRVLAPEG